MTSTVSRSVDGTPADVWAVLADGWLYGLWVVGASRIRSVDDTWPAPGSRIHHSVGSWPLLIDDTTIVRTSTPPHELELRARAWPTGEALVRISLAVAGDRTVVTLAEDASRGPARLVPAPVRRAGLDWRNRESLSRLSYLVERRGRTGSEQPEPPRPPDSKPRG